MTPLSTVDGVITPAGSRSSAMGPITETEVRKLAEDWFEAVRREDHADVQDRFFAPGVKIETWTGAAFDRPAHIRLHRNFENETHHMISLKLVPLDDAGTRVRVACVVQWEADLRAKQDEPRRVKCLVHEDWTIERGPGGAPRFFRYFSSSMEYLPGSALFELPDPDYYWYRQQISSSVQRSSRASQVRPAWRHRGRARWREETPLRIGPEFTLQLRGRPSREPGKQPVPYSFPFSVSISC